MALFGAEGFTVGQEALALPDQGTFVFRSGQVFPEEGSVHRLRPATGGVPPYSYSLSGGQSWMTVDSDMLAFQTSAPTPVTTLTSVPFSLVVTDSATPTAGRAEVAVEASVLPANMFGLVGHYFDDYSFTVGHPVDIRLPKAGPGSSLGACFLETDGCSGYAVSDNTPTRWGLTFNHAEATISGVPDAVVASSQIQYGARESATATPITNAFMFEIGATPADIVFHRVSPGDDPFVNTVTGDARNMVLQAGTSYDWDTPVKTPRFPRGVGEDIQTAAQELDYTIEAYPSGGETELPLGLELDLSNGRRTFSGTPTVPQPATNYLWCVGKDGQKNCDSFTITVSPEPLGLVSSVEDQVWFQGRPVSVTLPAGSGGSNAYGYMLAGTLPNGFSFDPTSRLLSGTPSELIDSANPVTLTYTVTDIADPTSTYSEEFTVVVNPPPSAPDAPPGLVARAAPGAITLSWQTIPNNGETLWTTQYRLKESDEIIWGVWTDLADPIGSMVEVSGLLNEISYDFEVRGMNGAGDGPVGTVSLAPPEGTNPNQPPVVADSNSLAVNVFTTYAKELVLADLFSDPEALTLDYFFEDVTDTVATFTLSRSGVLTITGVAVGTFTAQIVATDPVGASVKRPVVVTVAEAPNRDDIFPTGVSVTFDETNTELDVSWTAASFAWEGGSPSYAVRYKIAGTYAYFPTIFDPGTTTTFSITDCSGNAAITDCIPIEVCKTYTVEVAQRTSDSEITTVPDGTDDDWVQVYAEVPCGSFSGFPKVTRIEVENNAIIAEPGGLWTVVNVHTDRTPAADASVDLIWDELAGTGSAGREDLLFVNFPSRDTSNPDFASIRWHLEEDSIGNNFSGRQRVFAPRDSILERDPETANLRLVNFRGLDPEGSVRMVDVQIEDGNSTTVALHAITPDATSSGVVEEDAEIEIRASLSRATDSRCELSWSAEFAATDDEKLTKLEASDFDPVAAASGVFVFEAGQRNSVQFLSISNDRVPEGLESLRFSTTSFTCDIAYNTRWISGVRRSVDIKIRANDVPIVSSLVAGDVGGGGTDRAATVGWGLGGAAQSEVDSFVVRWVPEVTGEDDAFYLTGDNVTWETLAVGSASARSAVFPAVGRLDSETEYVVQVGVVTEAGADPLFSSELSRVTTGAVRVSAPVSVANASVFEGESFEVSVELPEALSEDVSISVGLVTGSGSDAAEVADFEAGPKTITIVAGETSGSVSFATNVDEDADDESLMLSVSSSSTMVELSPISIDLTIVELLDAPPPTGIMVMAGDGGSPVADADRRFRVDWSAPSEVTVASYQVGWVVKPSDGSVPADGEWMVVSVTDLVGVFPSGSALFRSSHATETGVGLEAGETYLVRVRSVVENGRLVWSEPMEVTLDDPITVTYEVDTEQVVEGGTVTLTATLSSPMSEDVDVTWMVVSDGSQDAVAGQHTAEADDVTVVSPVTETLTAGQTMLSKEFQANADADSDEDVFSPFVTFGGDVEEGARVLVTITEPAVSGGGGPNPTNPQPSVPPNTQPTGNGGQPPAGSGGQPANPGGSTGTLPTVGGGGSGLPSTGTPPTPGTGDQAQPSAGGFIDTVGTTHEANIDRLAEGGITRGCNPPSNTRFCPGRAVTRGEMATFMVRAFDLSASESNLFADDDGNTHEGNINALAVAEITRGCNPPENSRYCPDRPVTRAQMATFLARAMELAEGSGDFDDTADSPHANDINRIASVGITRGCNPPENSRFCPDRAVTRGEMATFLIRAEDLET